MKSIEIVIVLIVLRDKNRIKEKKEFGIRRKRRYFKRTSYQMVKPRIDLTKQNQVVHLQCINLKNVVFFGLFERKFITLIAESKEVRRVKRRKELQT